MGSGCVGLNHSSKGVIIMRVITKLYITIIMLLFACAAIAGSLTVPNIFTSGTKALASEVNDNFDAVKTEVDDNDLRMPGVAFVDENTCCSDVGTSEMEHQSIAIDAPTTGYVIVSYNGVCRLHHVNAATTIVQSIVIGISTTSGNTVTANRKSFTLPGNAGTGVHSVPCATQQVFPVTTGSATFYLNTVAVLPTAGESASIGWGNLHAVFVPNQY